MIVAAVKPSRIGTLIAGLATQLQAWSAASQFPMALTVIEERFSVEDITSALKLCVVPGPVKWDCETRSRKPGRDVTVNLYLGKNLDPQLPASLLTQQDQLIGCFESIADKIAKDAVHIQASNGSVEWILQSIDDDDVEPIMKGPAIQAQQFVAPWRITYHEERS